MLVMARHKFSANAGHGRSARPIADLQREARARSDRTFNPGIPCLHGHVCHRYTSSAGCVKCTDERRIERQAALPIAVKRAYYRVADKRRTGTRRVQRQQWYRVHAEDIKAAKRAAYASSPTIRLRQRANRLASPHRSRAYCRKWREGHPEATLAQNALRRARLVGAKSGCRKAYAAFVKWSRTSPRIACHWCGKQTVIGSRHRDHVIPLSRGGSDSVENLCIACPTCNNQKGAKLPEEFTGQSELRFA